MLAMGVSDPSVPIAYWETLPLVMLAA